MRAASPLFRTAASARLRNEAAAKLGVSRQTLHAILAETAAVTPEMAARLGKLCGNGPRLWLSLQQARDLWCVERDLAEELRKIPTLHAA